MGPLKEIPKHDNEDIALWGARDKIWFIGARGSCGGLIYALRIGSEIAKLNGLEPDEPKTARREWQIRVADDSNEKYPQGTVVSGHHGERHAGRPNDRDQWNYVTVREVLPGDPTPEQVEALVKTLENAFTFRVTNHPTWETEAKAALAPFLKP
jgi:hypothetical protein